MVAGFFACFLARGSSPLAESRQSHQARTSCVTSPLAAMTSAMLLSFNTRLVSPVASSRGCLPGSGPPGENIKLAYSEGTAAMSTKRDHPMWQPKGGWQ
jgi:hypothetical protein